MHINSEDAFCCQQQLSWELEHREIETYHYQSTTERNHKEVKKKRKKERGGIRRESREERKNWEYRKKYFIILKLKEKWVKILLEKLKMSISLENFLIHFIKIRLLKKLS